MLANIGVEPYELAHRSYLQSLLLQIVEGQYRCVARVTTAQRQPSSNKLLWVIEGLVAARNDHGGKFCIDISHAENLRCVAELALKGYESCVGVPADIYRAIEHGSYQALIVRVQNVVSGDASTPEVFTETLPNRDDPGMVGNCSDCDLCRLVHGTGSPVRALPIQLRSTALVGAITATARA